MAERRGAFEFEAGAAPMRVGFGNHWLVGRTPMATFEDGKRICREKTIA